MPEFWSSLQKGEAYLQNQSTIKIKKIALDYFEVWKIELKMINVSIKEIKDPFLASSDTFLIHLSQ